ncbi:MAG: thioredoxin TrxC [Cocleimonas sp.]
MTDKKHIVCTHCWAINRISTLRLTDNPMCGKCKKKLFTGYPIELNDQNFIKIINKSDIPILVDFWAEWCGPCKMMAPAFAEASNQLEPNIIFAKLNTEHAQQTAAQFGIRSIPCLILFKNGKEFSRQTGAMSATQIIQWTQSLK